MGRTGAAEEARERAQLLIRLAAIALGGTLVLLGRTGVLSLAAVVLALYLAAAVVLRYLPQARRWPLLGPAIDLISTTALVAATPLELGTWALYAFAIGSAALRSGLIGAIGATALAVVGYDAALIVRGDVAQATDLWPVQVLIGIGLVIAEVVWALGRGDLDAQWSSLHARALSSLTRQHQPDDLIRTLVHELGRLRTIEGAWAWRVGPDGRLQTTVSTGAVPPAEMLVPAELARAMRAPLPLDRIVPAMQGLATPLSTDPPLVIGVAMRTSSPDERATTTGAVHDLVGDAASLLLAAYDRVRRDERAKALDQTLRAVTAIAGERTQVGVIATTVLEAGRLIDGRVGMFRLADGGTIGGDLPAAPVLELARDRRLPAIVPPGPETVAEAFGRDAGVALLPMGEGRILVAVGSARTLVERLDLLERIADATRDCLQLAAERDRLQESATALGRDVESLGGALRAKEDAMATAVHELRNPLTAVHGYATLMSKNLKAVQGQVAQLERLMSELLSAEHQANAPVESVDAVEQAREAIARASVRGGNVGLEAPTSPVRVAIAEARFAQVLDNLIANAMKYSRAGSPIAVRVTAVPQGATISVTDRGVGIAPEHLDRIFDRFYRVTGAPESVAGQGLGLSICKAIVTAHGGRIWASSEGEGRGSTFSFTLPLAASAPVV